MEFADARRSLFALLLITVLSGMLAGHVAADHATAVMWNLVLEILFSFVSFVWYCRDSDARGYVRSRWLSIAMVSVALFAIPYYLWRSRPAGQRGSAILRFCGFLLLLLAVAGCGMAIGALFKLA